MYCVKIWHYANFFIKCHNKCKIYMNVSQSRSAKINSNESPLIHVYMLFAQTRKSRNKVSLIENVKFW